MHCELMQLYKVGPNETLKQIAEKFNLTARWIMDSNLLKSESVNHGDVLVINIIPELISGQSAPVPCFFLSNDGSDFVEGSLSVICESISFDPSKNSTRGFSYSLSGFIESNYQEIPSIGFPKSYSALQLSILSDLFDSNSLTSLVFLGQKEFLDFLRERIENLSSIIQSAPGIMLPPSKYDCSNLQKPRMNRLDSDEIQAKSLGFLRFLHSTRERARRLSLSGVEIIKGSNSIISIDEINELRVHFPHRYQSAKWTLIFKLSRDGTSYHSFYTNTEKFEPILMVILTGNHERIGAFMSCGLKLSKRFYGTGESFVFFLQPHLEVFNWSESNKYFVSSSKNEISIGGGNASAIWISGDFTNAFSESCSTFNSPQLTSNSHFKVIDIEVWHI